MNLINGLREKKGYTTMLKKYDKRRYVVLIPQDLTIDQEILFKTIRNLASELFGIIAIEQAFLKIIKIKSNKNILVIKCNLEKLDMILLAIALIYPPVAILGIHGTIKKLERGLYEDKDYLLQ